MPNKLATTYRSWRKEALREALKIAQEHGVEVKANMSIFDRHRLYLSGEPARGKEAPGYKQLQEACQEEGAEIRQDEGFRLYPNWAKTGGKGKENINAKSWRSSY